MKARMIKTAKAQELFNSVSDNLSIYRSGDFHYLMTDSTVYFEIDLEIDNSLLSSIGCTDKDHNEAVNCSIIYHAMGDLTPYLARDERLWIYLTHTSLLTYTRKRWLIPDDDEKAIKHIQNHFFGIGARGIERDNAASRLWWMASLCSRVEGLALDDALNSLLYQYDVRANLIERPTTSQNINVFSAVIMLLNESYKGDKSLFEREKFREVMKQLNLKGGTKVIGALSPTNVVEIIKECLPLEAVK